MFKLDPAFVESYRNRKPNWSPLAQVVYSRTYSRVKEDGSQETWCDTIQRVVEGTFTVLRNQVGRWDEGRAQRKAQEMFRRMWDFRFLPPGRGLWMMGTPYIERIGGAALNNCGFVSTEAGPGDDHRDFSYPYVTLMDYSMLGVGMGFDTKGADWFKVRYPEDDNWPFVVEDSREGWLSLIKRCLESFVDTGWNETTWPANVDYSKIRPAGAPIKGFGGVSSGPQPLMELVNDIRQILANRVEQYVRSTDIVDLMNCIGRCVVSGNVRRSAEIAIGSHLDLDFLYLKDPQKWPEQLAHHRWASNNTVLCDGAAMQEIQCITPITAKNGEPGFAWMDTIRAYGRLIDPPNWDDEDAMGFNPCGEQTLHNNELCCLVETFPTNHESLSDYLVTLKYAYLYAKAVTCIPTHNDRTNAVMSNNRRIGTSMAGISQMYSTMGMKECIKWWDTAYKYIRILDQDYSEWMGVPTSIKVTSVKPGGTVPILAGVEGGMKFPISEYYYRTVRMDSSSPLVQQLLAAGFRCEPDVVVPNTTVVYFPCHSKSKVYAKDVSMWEQMALFTSLQTWWSDNMVSATITFKPDEANQIARCLDAYHGRIKAVSFLPYSDHKFAQAPYIPITREEYEVAMANTVPEVLDIKHDTEDKFCDGDKCVV